MDLNMASVRRPLIWNRYVVEVKYCHWYILIRKRAGEKKLFSKTRIMHTKYTGWRTPKIQNSNDIPGWIVWLYMRSREIET